MNTTRSILTNPRKLSSPGRWISWALSAATLAGAFLANCPEAWAFTQVNQNLQAEQLYYVWVHVPAYTTYTWETTDLSVGADTVMHLWDWSTTSEVGFDDDGGAGLASRVSYTNNSASQKSLVLVVRSFSTTSQGTARLLENGSTKALINVGGTRVSVENGTGYQHETAQAPDGALYPWLLALDSSMHLVDVDYVSGVGSQARVEHPSTSFVVVGTTSGSGKVHLYSNDPTDNDGDGLGVGLEWDLGTCDLASWSHCGAVNNLTDTDRDGLPDAAEVFGIDDPNPQHLPAWGADPLHKDAFVEVDWTDSFSGQPFTEGDAVTAAAIYAPGSAADLVNPDGLGGVRLHIDAGVTPADPSNNTLIGDWGGANVVPASTSYITAANTNRDGVRAGVFRYALLSQGSGGQAAGVPTDRFGWGGSVSNRNIVTFAHELGHAVGLSHSGHSNWGAVNGKPNYQSLMNYAYNVNYFSLGEDPTVLNPAALDEEAGVVGDASLLTGSPYYRNVGPNGEVDWDFDQRYNPGGWGSSRGPVTYATWIGTNAFDQNEQSLHTKASLPATTPALILGPSGRLYAFYVDDNDRIYYRHALQNGSSWEGSCPGGDLIGDTCTSWSAAIEVPTSANARGLTVYWSGSQMLIAFRTQWDSLRTIRSTGYDGSGALTGWSNEIWHSAYTDKEPEVEFMRVDPSLFGGSSTIIALMYRDKNTGAYRWRTMTSTSASSTDRGAMLTDSGATLTGSESPTFTNWPYDPTSTADGTACGAITDTGGEVGLYCYDRATNRFTDLSATAFPSPNKPITVGKPGLAWHAYRSWAGVPLDSDPARGAFWLSVVISSSNWDFIDVWISDPVSEDPGESLSAVQFPLQHRGKFGNEWTNMVDGAGLALYDHPNLGVLKGLWLRQDTSDVSNPLGNVVLRFLPFADGGFRADLRDGNDFQVMERGICGGLASQAFCGPSSFGLD